MDKVVSQVRTHVSLGWPDAVDKTLHDQPYQNHKYELSAQDGCLLLGNHVVVPTQSREAVLGELHEGHPGIVHMKRLAWRYMCWWPTMELDNEDKVYRGMCVLSTGPEDANSSTTASLD